MLRPATAADLLAVTELYRADDVVWFGAPEHDIDEVRDELAPVADLAAQSALVFDETVLVGAAWWWGNETCLLAAAGPGRRGVLDRLLGAAVAAGQREAYSLARDTEQLAALEALGWRHVRSSFDLVRAVSPDWTLDEPVWPEGITVSPMRADEPAAVHELIYVDAAWDEVEGHHRRGFDEWRTIFLPADLPDPGYLVARRDGRPVGVALTRTTSDGTGWVNQLAVAASERGRGLGRALLLAALRGRRDTGARQLGLGVQAANATALTLYESVGLRIDREYRTFKP